MSKTAPDPCRCWPTAAGSTNTVSRAGWRRPRPSGCPTTSAASNWTPRWPSIVDGHEVLRARLDRATMTLVPVADHRRRRRNPQRGRGRPTTCKRSSPDTSHGPSTVLTRSGERCWPRYGFARRPGRACCCWPPTCWRWIRHLGGWFSANSMPPCGLWLPATRPHRSASTPATGAGPRALTERARPVGHRAVLGRPARRRRPRPRCPTGRSGPRPGRAIWIVRMVATDADITRRLLGFRPAVAPPVGRRYRGDGDALAAARRNQATPPPLLALETHGRADSLVDEPGAHTIDTGDTSGCSVPSTRCGWSSADPRDVGERLAAIPGDGLDYGLAALSARRHRRAPRRVARPAAAAELSRRRPHRRRDRAGAGARAARRGIAATGTGSGGAPRAHDHGHRAAVRWAARPGRAVAHAARHSR